MMLPKATVLKVADQVRKNDQQQVQNGTNQLMTMNFELQPSPKTSIITIGNMSTSMGTMGSKGSMPSGSTSR